MQFIRLGTGHLSKGARGPPALPNHHPPGMHAGPGFRPGANIACSPPRVCHLQYRRGAHGGMLAEPLWRWVNRRHTPSEPRAVRGCTWTGGLPTCRCAQVWGKKLTRSGYAVFATAPRRDEPPPSQQSVHSCAAAMTWPSARSAPRTPSAHVPTRNTRATAPVLECLVTAPLPARNEGNVLNAQCAGGAECAVRAEPK